jgi:hypothetical protein
MSHSPRSGSLLALRPTITATAHADASAIEGFQTQALRPILKFQHAVLCRCCAHFLAETRQSLEGKTPGQQAAILGQALRNNTLHHTLLGMVTALMTEEEYDFYLLHQKECNRRITNMLAQRLLDFFA